MQGMEDIGFREWEMKIERLKRYTPKRMGDEGCEECAGGGAWEME